LHNFRSHKNAHFSFNDGVNVIVGENGIGKTNILEAIHFLATAKSHRTGHEREMITHGEEFAFIKAEFEARDRKNTIEGRLWKQGKKQFAKNFVPIRKTSDLMGFISVIMFAPGDLSIIQGSPGVRRKFLDLAICQMSKKYFHLLSTYNRILAQKNKLLKTDNAQNCLDMLEVWNTQLAGAGEAINEFRNNYLVLLEEHAKIHFAEMMNKTLEISYIPNGNGILGDLEKNIKKALKKEIKLGQAEIGPHRDDFLIKIGGAEGKEYASQGQQRTAIIALKKAQLDILCERLDEPPILLLDDVMSELDLTRQHLLLDTKMQCQTIITATRSKNATIQLN
jgi:DNA replication and repair protein RecF